MVWGSREIIISLENSLYITAGIYCMRHFGPILTPKPIQYNQAICVRGVSQINPESGNNSTMVEDTKKLI
jgi:hypothetical protein